MTTMIPLSKVINYFKNIDLSQMNQKNRVLEREHEEFSRLSTLLDEVEKIESLIDDGTEIKYAMIPEQFENKDALKKHVDLLREKTATVGDGTPFDYLQEDIHDEIISYDERYLMEALNESKFADEVINGDFQSKHIRYELVTRNDEVQVLATPVSMVAEIMMGFGSQAYNGTGIRTVRRYPRLPMKTFDGLISSIKEELNRIKCGENEEVNALDGKGYFVFKANMYSSKIDTITEEDIAEFLVESGKIYTRFVNFSFVTDVKMAGIEDTGRDKMFSEDEKRIGLKGNKDTLKDFVNYMTCKITIDLKLRACYNNLNKQHKN